MCAAQSRRQALAALVLELAQARGGVADGVAQHHQSRGNFVGAQRITHNRS
jgi:hypothetical protein